MKKSKSFRSKWVWLSALVLFICVFASAFVIANEISAYLFDDSGAIVLIPESASSAAGETAYSDTSQSAADLQRPSDENALSAEEQNGAAFETFPPKAGQPKSPGFSADDDKKVWTTDTQVEIFRVSYENGAQVVTVKGEDGDRLIAPGTENSYTFKLKNTGNTALDYTVSVDASFTPEDISIPISCRISRCDGEWICGDINSYADAGALDSIQDSATLGAGRYTYYTLDWRWPFESENDEHDTLLGNMAASEDLLFTIRIVTTAAEAPDTSAGGGLLPPKTGDHRQIALWLGLMLVSFIIITLLKFLPKRRKEREDGGTEDGKC